MKLMNSVVIAIVGVLLVSCKGISIESPINNTFDQRSNATYAWSANPLVSDSSQNSRLYWLDSTVRVELDRQLTTKGYVLSDRDKADFLISYNYFTQSIGNQAASKSLRLAENERWLVSVRFDDTQSDGDFNPSGQEASLQVRLESQNGDLLWQSVAKKTIENRFASESRYKEVVHAAITKMLTDFPGKGRK